MSTKQTHACALCDKRPKAKRFPTFLMEAVAMRSSPKQIRSILSCPKHKATIATTDVRGCTALSLALEKDLTQIEFETVRLLVQADCSRNTLFVHSDYVQTALNKIIDMSLETSIPEEIHLSLNHSEYQPPHFDEIFWAYSIGVAGNLRMPSSNISETLRYLIRETYQNSRPFIKEAKISLLHMMLHLSANWIGNLQRKNIKGAKHKMNVYIPVYPAHATLAVASAIMEKYPHMVLEQDFQGNLPVHLIAHLPNSVQLIHPKQALENQHRKITFDLLKITNPKEELARRLLSQYPFGVHVKNMAGDLPLHYILKFSRELEWETDGIYVIWKAFPRASMVMDKQLKLFPFMLSAIRDTNINTTYNLLRVSPEIATLFCSS